MVGLLPKPRAEMAPEGDPGMPAAGDEMTPGAGDEMTPPGAEGEETPNVSPEEQAQYNRFVGNGMNLIFGDRARAEALVSRIAKSQSPIEGLASTAVHVVTRIQKSAEEKGVRLSPDVLMHGGMEILQNLADLAAAAKIHDFTPDELEQATYMALDMYGTQEVERGAIDREAVAQDFQAMIEADRAGRLDELIPGISEKARQIEQGPPMRMRLTPETASKSGSSVIR